MTGALWQARLGYWTRRLGWPGGLGALLLLAALILLQMQLLPAMQRLSDASRRASAAQQRLTQQASTPDKVALTPTQQVNAFYEAFPSPPDVPDILASVYQIAAAKKLELDLGEYTLTRQPGARLDRLRITLPVKGSYTQVRQFTADALAEQSALARESVSVRREKVTDDLANGRIVFLLFVEHAP